MDDDLFYFNGVDATTGTYGLPPLSAERLASVIEGEPDAALLRELKWRAEASRGVAHFGVRDAVDPNRLDQTGWGVVFAHDADPAIREALSPLLTMRRQQAGRLYREYSGAEGFRVGKDTKMAFLRRHGVGPGPVDPEKAPYHVLIVGDPERIPFRFQSQLDVQFSVGRIDFGQDLEAYDRYARSVVAAESGEVERARRVAFFAPTNRDDRATTASAEHLIAPLVEHFRETTSWDVSQHLGDGARKADLASLLGEAPALLFTASHGMEFPNGDPRQLRHQGAILCQDWPGPKTWRGPIPEDHYFAADDLASDADLTGTMAFFFACYGGGTPKVDDFAKQGIPATSARRSRPTHSSPPCPCACCRTPAAARFAVVGHVERAWGCSFLWPGAGSQTTVFETTLGQLLDRLDGRRRARGLRRALRRAVDGAFRPARGDRIRRRHRPARIGAIMDGEQRRPRLHAAR